MKRYQVFSPEYLNKMGNVFCCLARQDSTYKNLIRSSRRYVDDCIWFSDRIASDLNSYGTELRNRNRLKSFRVIKSNFDGETRKHIQMTRISRHI
jgi:hypothetical protein